MIILHDSPSSDLSHIQAMALEDHGFALYDYIRIEQNDKSWIGQIVRANRNVSTVGNPLDPTILHGLQLMQSHDDVQSVQSVQVFDILILGEYDGNQILTPRIRPFPGAPVTPLDTGTISKIIGIPQKILHSDASVNVIGELLNADGVPLCIEERTFNHHIMIAGGTGSGKSNIAANVIDQAMKFDKCALVHDAKPDYEYIRRQNTDKNVTAIWNQFHKYGLSPRPSKEVKRVGFHGKCDPERVDIIAGLDASDLDRAMLAGFFFPESSEYLQFEMFMSAINSLSKPYSLNDILKVVEKRMGENVDPAEQIFSSTGHAILRKVRNRRVDMTWLDAIGEEGTVKFNLNVSEGRILVIDYSQVDDSSYALLLSYVLDYCQGKRSNNEGVGIVHMVDEAHRIFDNESRHNDTLAGLFNRIMREGRTHDHSIVLSLQNASQIPHIVMNNLNTHVVMRQNSRDEADAATQTMGTEYATESLRLGTGHALVRMFESRFTVPVQMAPSPFELMRSDNTGDNRTSRR